MMIGRLAAGSDPSCFLLPPSLCVLSISLSVTSTFNFSLIVSYNMLSVFSCFFSSHPPRIRQFLREYCSKSSMFASRSKLCMSLFLWLRLSSCLSRLSFCISKSTYFELTNCNEQSCSFSLRFIRRNRQ